MKTLMTAAEVAQLLRVSTRKFEQMVAANSAPPFIRLGRLRRWRSQAVYDWIDTCPINGKPTTPSDDTSSGA